MTKKIEKESKTVEDLTAELQSAQNKLRELAEKEKTELRQEIEKLAADRGYFCGVIIDNVNLPQIVELAMTKKDRIQIPFALYKVST